MATLTSDLGRRELTLLEKIRGVSWGLVLLVFTAACFGIAVLYSAADGNMQPWAAAQTIRFAIALIPMIGAALLGIRLWFRVAYWAYAIALALVAAVDLRGFVGMGARRWIDLGVIQLQPSELMKLWCWDWRAISTPSPTRMSVASVSSSYPRSWFCCPRR